MRSKAIFDEKFLSYLENFRFECDVWAIREGTPVFPFEPIVTVRGPIIQAQFIETMVLLTINHQSLIATKASPHGQKQPMAGRFLSSGPAARRAATVRFSVRGLPISAAAKAPPALWLTAISACPQSERWRTAGFRRFPANMMRSKLMPDIYPSNCTFLVDTYSVLKSGIPKCYKSFKRGSRAKGLSLKSDPHRLGRYRLSLQKSASDA